MKWTGHGKLLQLMLLLLTRWCQGGRKKKTEDSRHEGRHFLYRFSLLVVFGLFRIRVRKTCILQWLIFKTCLCLSFPHRGLPERRLPPIRHPFWTLPENTPMIQTRPWCNTWDSVIVVGFCIYYCGTESSWALGIGVQIKFLCAKYRFKIYSFN